MPWENDAKFLTLKIFVNELSLTIAGIGICIVIGDSRHIKTKASMMLRIIPVNGIWQHQCTATELLHLVLWIMCEKGLKKQKNSCLCG